MVFLETKQASKNGKQTEDGFFYFSCFFSFFRALQFVLAHSAILIIPFGC